MGTSGDFRNVWQAALVIAPGEKRPDWAFHAALVAAGADPERTSFVMVLDALKAHFDSGWKKCLKLSPSWRSGAWVGTGGWLSIGREHASETPLFVLSTMASVLLDVRLVITDDAVDPVDRWPEAEPWLGPDQWRPLEVHRPFSALLSMPFLNDLRSGSGVLMGPDAHSGRVV